MNFTTAPCGSLACQTGCVERPPPSDAEAAEGHAPAPETINAWRQPQIESLTEV